MLDDEGSRLDLLDRNILGQRLRGECESVDERHSRCSSDRGTVVVGGTGARRYARWMVDARSWVLDTER